MIHMVLPIVILPRIPRQCSIDSIDGEDRKRVTVLVGYEKHPARRVDSEVRGVKPPHLWWPTSEIRSASQLIIAITREFCPRFAA